VSSIVSSYTGPRKYDIVIWDTAGSIVLVSQSQMYSSDVGSIQGKTVEEDSIPNKAVKSKYPECCVLTHTEGFGCHTSMISRLKHVLSSEIDGFMQIKTLDTKLRDILRKSNCCSLIDFEVCLFTHKDGLSFDALAADVVSSFQIHSSEVSRALGRYIENGYLIFSDGHVLLKPERAIVAAYYYCIDQFVMVSSDVHGAPHPYFRLGGLAKESCVPNCKAEDICHHASAQASGFGANIGAEAILSMCFDRGVLVKSI